MGVSTVDGELIEAIPGRRAAKVRIFKQIVFRLADGSTKTIAKPNVHADLASHLQPGLRGRFYLFTSIDHRGLHGFRDEHGRAMFHFPRNNEIAMLVCVLLCGLWCGFTIWKFGDAPILPTLIFILGVPAFFLFRNTRKQAARQYREDTSFAPPPASSVLA